MKIVINEIMWCSEGMKEAPFYYPGITMEEYEEERAYFQKHVEEWQNGEYMPLRCQGNMKLT